MKRYLSVFEMITRSSIYKVLLILVGMVTVEAVCFYLSMTNPSGLNIEEYIDQSQYSLIFKLAYVLVTIVIVLPGMNLGSVQSYTLQRLRIKENRIFWIQALYNVFAYVLLWGTQLMILLGSAWIYQNNLPKGAVWTTQTLFLAFHRNEFMHTILPIEDVLGWWMIALAGITLALATAGFTRLQRKRKFGFELLILVAATLIYFPRQLGYDIAFMVLTYAFIYVVMGFRVVSESLGGD